MEKTVKPKRYNLKPPVDPNKPTSPSIRCPKCKSKNVKVISRRRYFLKSAACAIIALPYWFLLLSLKEQDIPEPPATIMLLVILILSFPLAVYGLYCFISGILIKQTSYKCRYCKNRFHDPFFDTV